MLIMWPAPATTWFGAGNAAGEHGGHLPEAPHVTLTGQHQDRHGQGL